ncbi:hypothetical protein FO519_007777 [Halicephalobus sp. NKZ332]|nr:hypothetical protein FO519_007777 [Halicephalobus sp. NKZ332]
MLVVDPTLLTVESLARAAVILAVGLLLFFSSVISIVVLISNKTLHDCIGYFLISLACADLLSATCIIPLSMYSSLHPDWRFWEDNSPICKVSAYLHIVVLCSTIYTFIWVAVDRHSAFMKPSRYDSEHTLTRCKCWIAFSWVSAILIALPILITKMEAQYHQEFEMCVIKVERPTIAYSLTLAVLVIGPVLGTIVFTAYSVGRALKRPEELEDIQRTIIDNDRNFIVTVFTMVVFVLSWMPIVILLMLPSSWVPPEDASTMKFAFMWLAVGGSSSKLLIFFFINSEFRKTFYALCTGNVYSDSSSYGSSEFVGCCLPENRSFLTSLVCCFFCGCCIFWRKACCCDSHRTYIRSSPVHHQQIIPQNLVNSRHLPEYGSFSRYATGYA